MELRSRWYRSVWVVFVVALGFRAALLFGVANPQEVLGRSPWEFGQEQASLAASLLRGDGLSDPFGKGTGPSAWLTPLYPALLALVFRVFGLVTADAALALFVLQGLVSAATVVAIDRIGVRLDVPRAGRIGAWLFAFHPIAAWYAVHKVWDTALVSAATAGVVLLALRIGRRPTWRGAALLGACFGALLMLNPAPVSFVPALALWLAPRADGRGIGLGRQSVQRVAAFTASTALVCAPWIVRNILVLDTLALRSNLGVELFVGNNDLAQGWHVTELHPGWSEPETSRLRELGERGYAEEAGARARTWIGAHPGRFFLLAAAKARIYWIGEYPPNDPREFDGVRAAEDPKSWVRFVVHAVTGVLGAAGLLALAARRRAETTLVAALALGLFPVVYYVTHALERYRFPVDPLLLIGCGVVLQFALGRSRGARN